MFLLEVRFHVNKTFSYEKFSTRTHFEAEAQGNFTIAHFVCRAFARDFTAGTFAVPKH